MSFPPGHVDDDQVLARYLLGSASAEEVERLDEHSIADDQLALRLHEVENDLVDAYVRGELAGETLERFQSHYLCTPARRSKVSFAQALLAYQSGPARASAPATSRGRWLSTPWIIPRWGPAAALLLLLIAAGYLLVQNTRLRNQATAARAERTTLQQRAQELERQLDAQRSADGETAKELARVRESLAQLEAGKTSHQDGSTFVLSTRALPLNRVFMEMRIRPSDKFRRSRQTPLPSVASLFRVLRPHLLPARRRNGEHLQ
jgi:hypothetical protein